MATTSSLTTSFKGTFAGPILEQAFKAADTIDKGLITFLPNIIGNAILPKLTISQSLSADSCGWLPTGTVALVEKEIVTKRFSLQLELCKLDFRNTYTAQADGAQDDVPSSIKEAVLLDMVNNLGAIVDYQIWNGTGVTASFNGLLPQFIADSEVLDITGVTVSSANVVAELSKVYNMIPKEIKKTAIIVVSDDVEAAYKLAQATMGTNTSVGDKQMDFAGIKLYSIGGLPANNMVAYRVKNVNFATGLQSELNGIDVVDSDAYNLDNLVKAKASFNAGVGYSFGAEIVYYRP